MKETYPCRFCGAENKLPEGQSWVIGCKHLICERCSMPNTKLHIAQWLEDEVDYSRALEEKIINEDN